MQHTKIIIVVGVVITLISCNSSETVKRDSFAPKVSSKFDLEGHLQSNKRTSTNGETYLAPIPSLVQTQAIIIDPNKYKVKKLYSVSAINVPVTDLLFNLAIDANKELNLSSSVTGLVTINAVSKPLDSILQRVAEQVRATFQVENNVITVKEDLPYWHTYRIDYVNISKEINDKMSLNMTVGSDKKSSSRFETKSFAKHDMWASLLENIKAMVHVKKIEKIKHESKIEKSKQIKSTKKDSEKVKKTTIVEGAKTVVINREAGLISVNASRSTHNLVKNYIDSVVNRTTRQVLIEATVVEVELSDKYQAGVDWSASDSTGNASQNILGSNISNNSGFSLNLSSVGSFNFNLGIKMLQQFGDAKVLSSPKIMALNNQSALLKVVDNEVYFTVEVNRESATANSSGSATFSTEVNTVPVGFMMNMTPFISDEEDITIKIRPTLSRIVGHVNDPNPDLARENIVSKIPIIQEREMDSILRLRNKQTAILGGLIQDKHSKERTGVPFLSSIPLLGDLFSYRSDEVKKSELIIFIRPVIITNPNINNGDLQQVKNFLKTKTN